jgi:predicted HicB family RNase H-like nuclease
MPSKVLLQKAGIEIIDPKLARRLEAKAKKEGTSVRTIVNLALERYLEGKKSL